MCKDCCAQRLKQVVIHISGVPSLPKMFAFMPQPSNLSLMQRCQLPYDYFLAVCSVLLAQKQCILKPCILHCVPKKWASKHFATAIANLHRFKWNFTHTRRHLFLSLTSNFIWIPYSVYEMFNFSNCCHKSQLPIQVTSCWRHLWWQVWRQCVLINKQYVIKRGSSFNKNAESWKRIRC